MDITITILTYGGMKIFFDPKSPWIPGKFPALRGQESHSGRWWNSFYTREVNYLRLRNLVVGYSLPKNWIRKVGMEQCRIYFQGTNLFLSEFVA